MASIALAVDPSARIMPVQVLDGTGLGKDSDIIKGLVWAADHGANVILMSFAGTGYSPGPPERDRLRVVEGRRRRRRDRQQRLGVADVSGRRREGRRRLGHRLARPPLVGQQLRTRHVPRRPRCRRPRERSRRRHDVGHRHIRVGGARRRRRGAATRRRSEGDELRSSSAGSRERRPGRHARSRPATAASTWRARFATGPRSRSRPPACTDGPLGGPFTGPYVAAARPALQRSRARAVRRRGGTTARRDDEYAPQCR